MSKPPVHLANETRSRLLQRVEAIQDAALVESAQHTAAQANSTDFSTLPGYDDLRIYRSLGQKFGLESPYFRMHDGRAGAHTQIAGRSLLNFSCYDYLGINGHPEIIATAKETLDRYGVSASASRHVAGERPVHRALEKALADHYGVEDSIVFVSGYATNLGVIGHLVGPKDLLVYDSLSHNSIVMGGVLSNGARRSFPHNDLDSLDRMLTSVRGDFHRSS